MKKIIALIFVGVCLFAVSCNKTDSQTKSDGEKSVISSFESGNSMQLGEQYEKRPIRMFNFNGDLYYDTGLEASVVSRCGTMDGNLNMTVKENEIPLNSGESNFNSNGFQNATSISKEVNINGEWVIFKKYDYLPEDLADYKYCFYIKGHLNNAEVDSEIVVLTDNVDVTFNDVFAPMLSYVDPQGNNDSKICHTAVISGDKWGITLYGGNITPNGLALGIEQFGEQTGNKYQTGTWFKLEKAVNDEWTPVETNPLIDFAWEDIAYSIKQNDITKLNVEWKWLYGELSSGYYRLTKEIECFKSDGSYDKDLYDVYFNVE